MKSDPQKHARAILPDQTRSQERPPSTSGLHNIPTAFLTETHLPKEKMKPTPKIEQEPFPLA